MATVHGTVEQPLEEASNSTRGVAASQGYTLAEGQDEPNVLVFKKGASAFSWGSQLTVELESASPSQTRLTVSTAETWAITDWGRGKRAANRLLDALGATH
jgi:hypothetical protein